MADALTVFLGLGSNMGDREKNIRLAVENIAAAGAEIKQTASLLETEAVGGAEQNDFLNTAVRVSAEYAPHKLLEAVKSVEFAMGREESWDWGPRNIDIDILFYGDRVIVTPDLVIPHPLVCERIFTLKPMVELAPDLVHPVFNRKLCDIYRERRDVLSLYHWVECGV